MTIAQAGETIALTDSISTLIPNGYFVEKADFKVNSNSGKVVEQKLANDNNQALIWDNNVSMPLALVDNAYVADVAYTSFESSETGNWIYSSGSVVSDATGQQVVNPIR